MKNIPSRRANGKAWVQEKTGRTKQVQDLGHRPKKKKQPKTPF